MKLKDPGFAAQPGQHPPLEQMIAGFELTTFRFDLTAEQNQHLLNPNLIGGFEAQESYLKNIWLLN
jgi:hypothetical protein